MRAIYKYKFVEGIIPTMHHISMHSGASILKIDRQRSEYCIWAIVDTDAPIVSRKISLLGTGWEIEDQDISSKNYIGSCQIEDENFVWHFFDSGEEK